ncbi:MAG TPA: cyclodeaminase/cyclohydrolase family protein, partial [Candidatus Rifleibacterium sp.]|nr:cyclodeaminase/cyclohydrolase family protein [Candidatus Rifleibacterium sp.]
SKSDMQVGARALEVGIWGAYQNVMINMAGIKDEKFVNDVTAEAVRVKERAEKFCSQIQKLLENRKE